VPNGPDLPAAAERPAALPLQPEPPPLGVETMPLPITDPRLQPVAFFQPLVEAPTHTIEDKKKATDRTMMFVGAGLVAAGIAYWLFLRK
jgi:hypothetical protein